MPLMKTYVCIVFTNGMSCWYTFFMTDTKIKEHVPFESWEEKKLACTVFGKICYVACTTDHTGQLVCLCASLHEHDCAGLIDKPAVKSKVQ